MKMKNKSFLKNNHGMLSVDFLFTMVMSMLLCIMFFALTTTFSVVEISQYIAFSTARAYIAGHVNEELQRQSANNKFSELTGKDKAITPLIKNGWYTLTLDEKDIRGGVGHGDVFSDYHSPSDTRLPAMGVRLSFTAKVLNLNLSFLGSTKREDDYSANVTGLLIREPTQQECQDWMGARWEKIKTLDGRFSSLVGNVGTPFIQPEDNGC